MVTLTFGDSKSIMAELSRRAGNTMDVSMLVRERLAEYLSTPLQTLFQVSSSGSLVQGVYSEAVTCAKTLEHGDFGLGTFTGLDGEMVVLEGHVYRVQGAGRVSQASVGDGAPFAIVTRFEPSTSKPLRLSHLQSWRSNATGTGGRTTCSMPSGSLGSLTMFPRGQ